MPRYFLHVHDDIEAPDEEGCEFGDLDAARAAALDGARGLLCEQIKQGYLHLDHHIEIATEGGQTLAKISYGDAFEVRHRPQRLERKD